MKNSSSYRIVLLLAGIIAGILIGITWQRVQATFSDDKINSLLYLIDKKYVDSVNVQSLVEEAIPDILKGLDPHSVYIPANSLENVNSELAGHFSGIGISFNMLNDSIYVVSVIRGGPSEKAGLLPGDRITKVNDTLYVGSSVSSDLVMRKM
ncbi:MAG: PDZ domain-containing protein, partial [Bacteroidales bacterium]|nr:PDZ domain-containing protein [Bacteroidales bacterium]